MGGQRHEYKGLMTKVYFKPKGRNSYLSIRIGHHPLWLQNIPHSQIMHIRRICTYDDDFISQSQITRDRFIQNGYPGDKIESTIKEILTIPWEQCLQDAVKCEREDGQKQWNFRGYLP